jgi:hypothetical protein
LPEESGTKEPQKEVEHKTIRGALRAHLRDSAPKEEKPSEKPSIETLAPEKKVEPSAHTLPPPRDMNAQERAFWDTLPNETKQYLARRHQEIEKERSRFIQEMRDKEALYPELDALKDVREEYARQGINPADIVKRSIAWDKFFRTDPVSAARQYLEAYGVDPAELTQAQSQNGAAIPREYLDRVSQMEAKIAEYEKQKEMEAQARVAETTTNVIKSFAATKPLLSDPALPQELADQLGEITQAVRAQYPLAPVQDVLEESYRRFEASPSVAAMLAAKKQQGDASKAKAEAEKAKRASRTISGGPGTGSPAKKANSLRDSLRANFYGDA